MTSPRSPFQLLRALVPGTMAAILLAGILPGPAQAGAADPGGVTPDATTVDAGPPPESEPLTDEGGEGQPGQLPSQAYADLAAHADDDIEFTPGARVSVGFTPRSGDAWPVGGAAPVALPAGRASGHAMAAMRNGSTWARPIGGAQDSKGDATKDDAADPAAPDAGSGDPSATPAPVDQPSNRFTLAATSVTAEQPATDASFDLAAASGLRRQVYGFLPYWEVSGASTRLNYDVLSTIAYFSVGATGSGNLKKRDGDGTLTTGWGGWTSSSMTKVINAAHQKGTRVVLSLSVFAWTSSQASVQRSLLGSSAHRLNFVRQAVAAVRDRGADGVNLDFEPLARGYEDEFVSLLRTFRSEFNKVRSGYSITYDTTAFIGNYPLERSVGSRAADAIFVMGYDYRIYNARKSGSIDPLSGPSYDLADTVRAYRARVPASRLILGLPWYGRAWSTDTDKPRSDTRSGLKYGYSTAVNYSNVLPFVEKYGRRWDPVEQSPYVAYRRRNCTSTYGCVTTWRQIWYDDAASMKKRYQLVNDYGLRGAGLWALGYDGGHNELYRALADSFLVAKAAPNAGIKSLDATQGDEGFLVRWAAKDPRSVVSYDVQVSVNGGGWKTWRSRTKATSDVFLGRSGTGYAFRVRATDTSGHTGTFFVVSTYDATPSLVVGGFGTVRRDGLSYRTGPDTSAPRLGTLRAGTIVALTRGPVKADGKTWFEVTQPIRQWAPTSFVERGVWVAVADGTTRLVLPYRAPNSTLVRAGIRGLSFGPGGASGSGVGSAAAPLAVRAFSPNGDGSEDALQLRWTNTVRLDRLKVNIRRADGTLLASRTLPDLAAGAQTWNWDGRAAGTRLKDGSYVLQLVGTAGGRTYTAPSVRPATKEQRAAYGVRIDTAKPRITAATATNQAISPNGDGVKDSTKLTLTAAGGAVRWTATVRNAKGTVVRSASGAGTRASLTWAGTSNAGRRVADGEYTVTLALYDTAGNAATRSGRVTVDTTGPRGTATASIPAFSPNGDGLLDTSVLSWTADEASTGTARLFKGSTLVRTWKLTGTTAWKTAWDGRRADGRRVSEGVYTLKVDVRDGVGNRRVVSTRVIVDRTLKGLAWAGDFYPQDGDSVKRTSALTFGLTRDAKTTLRIRDAQGTIVRTAWSGKAQADGTRGFTWDGRRDDGSFAPQGRYLATLRVRSPWATVEYSRWVWAAGFTLTANRATVKPGQSLVVRFRSVEKLSTTPRVTFSQPGRSGVTVTATKLSDGSWKASFPVRSGGTGTGVVRVSATDASGAPNATRITLRVAS